MSCYEERTTQRSLALATRQKVWPFTAVNFNEFLNVAATSICKLRRRCGANVTVDDDGECHLT